MLAGLAGGSYGLYSHLKGRKAQQAEAVEGIVLDDSFMSVEGNKIAFEVGPKFIDEFTGDLKAVKIVERNRRSAEMMVFIPDYEIFGEDGSVVSLEDYRRIVVEKSITEAVLDAGMLSEEFEDGISEEQAAKLFEIAKANGMEKGSIFVYVSEDGATFSVSVASLNELYEFDREAGKVFVDLTNVVDSKFLKNSLPLILQYVFAGFGYDFNGMDFRMDFKTFVFKGLK